MNNKLHPGGRKHYMRILNQKQRTKFWKITRNMTSRKITRNKVIMGMIIWIKVTMKKVMELLNSSNNNNLGKQESTKNRIL